MGWISQYDLGFKGLKEGYHKFGYDVEDKFFGHFDQDLVSTGKLKIEVMLEKRSTFLKLFFKIKGWIELTCDRCLELYRQPIVYQDEILVKFGEPENINDDEIMWIMHGDHKLNLAQLIYEFIVVSIPLKHMHPSLKNGEYGCNLEMIKKLEQYRPKNHEVSEPDPRWEALKNIKY